MLGGSTTTIMAGATITPALPGMERHFAAEPHAELLVLTLPGLAIMVSSPLLALAAAHGVRRGRDVSGSPR